MKFLEVHAARISRKSGMVGEKTVDSSWPDPYKYFGFRTIKVISVYRLVLFIILITKTSQYPSELIPIIKMPRLSYK